MMEFLGLSGDQWIQVGIALGLVVVSALVVRWLLGYLLGLLLRRLLGETGKRIHRGVIQPVRGPLNIAAVLVAANIAVLRLDFLVSDGLAVGLDNVFFALYVLVGLMLAVRLTGSLLEWYGREVAPRTESELDDQLIPFVRRIAFILLTVVGLIILLGRFEIDVSGLVATLGIGSLAIALAAQAALADTISGFIIMVDRPYRIGDRIEIQDLDTWGDVVDIGLRSSRIRTRDNRMVIVPNSVLGKSLIVNYSYPDTTYRNQIEIGVAYGTDIEQARETIIDTVKNVEGVLQGKKVEALFLHWGDSALIFRVRWWLDSYVDTRRMFDRVNSAIYHALAEAGIEIPNPSRDLYHRFEEQEVGRLAAAFGGRG
jgi:small-conductance mechanosensitive channel